MIIVGITLGIIAAVVAAACIFSFFNHRSFYNNDITTPDCRSSSYSMMYTTQPCMTPRPYVCHTRRPWYSPFYRRRASHVPPVYVRSSHTPPPPYTSHPPAPYIRPTGYGLRQQTQVISNRGRHQGISIS